MDSGTGVLLWILRAKYLRTLFYRTPLVVAFWICFQLNYLLYFEGFRCWLWAYNCLLGKVSNNHFCSSNPWNTLSSKQMLKVSNRNLSNLLNLTVGTGSLYEQLVTCLRSLDVFIVNFKQISHALIYLLCYTFKTCTKSLARMG